MGLMDDIRRLTHPYAEPEDDYDDYDDEDELTDEEDTAPAAPRRSPFASRNASSATAAATEPPRTATAGRVVNISSGQFQVVWENPQSFEAVAGIADHLLSKKAVVLNLEKTNTDTARRVVDFLYGCAHALGGTLKKIANRTYFVTPCNIDLVKGDSENITGTEENDEDVYV